nr:unnamed protein product [Digitaria exilis]
METSVVVLSVVVLLFAVASAVLGLSPRPQSYVLGICAAVLMVAAQIIASVAGACCCCCLKPSQQGGASSPKWKKAIISAGSGGAGGGGLRAGRGVERGHDAVTVGWLIECHYLKGAVFRRAALLGLAAAVLGICSG